VTRVLFRIAGRVPASDAGRSAWERALATHIRASPLTSVWMRVADAQRSYVVLDGCGRCADDDCTIGCRAALFGRAVRACLDGGTLTRVSAPQGLAARPYRYGALCWPTGVASALAPDLLPECEELRMLLHWQHGPGGIRVGGMLLGAEPVLASLRAQGWTAVPVPQAMVRRLGRMPLPPVIPGRLWHAAPCVLFEAPRDQTRETVVNGAAGEGDHAEAHTAPVT
jgi:hypothetical protein